MSAPLPLLVPAPSLVFKAVAGTYAPLEDAVALSFPAVRFPDGSEMTADDFAGAQALLARTLTPGSTPDVWDPEARAWRPSSGVDLNQLNGVPLLPPKVGAAPWEGLLLGTGQKDAAGAPQIQPATAHFPQYRLRGAFRARRGTIEAFGLGPESEPLEFASAMAAGRFAAELTPDAAGATRVRIVLRNATAQTVGFLEIDASGGNTAVTLANFDAAGAALAAVTLQPDGVIRLTPAAGMRVVVAGDLEAEHIRYQPTGGLLKKDLS